MSRDTVTLTINDSEHDVPVEVAARFNDLVSATRGATHVIAEAVANGNDLAELLRKFAAGPRADELPALVDAAHVALRVRDGIVSRALSRRRADHRPVREATEFSPEDLRPGGTCVDDEPVLALAAGEG